MPLKKNNTGKSNKPLLSPNIKELHEINKKISKNINKNTVNRFLNYAKISSQSIDTADMNVFPISPGQIKIAEYLENELCGICKGSDATIIAVTTNMCM